MTQKMFKNMIKESKAYEISPRSSFSDAHRDIGEIKEEIKQLNIALRGILFELKKINADTSYFRVVVEDKKES